MIWLVSCFVFIEYLEILDNEMPTLKFTRGVTPSAVRAGHEDFCTTLAKMSQLGNKVMSNGLNIIAPYNASHTYSKNVISFIIEVQL